MENENPYENTPVEEIPFEDMSIEELDVVLDETTPILEFELLEDILEVLQYGYVLGWLIFALLFFILIFVAIGSGKK